MQCNGMDWNGMQVQRNATRMQCASNPMQGRAVPLHATPCTRNAMQCIGSATQLQRNAMACTPI
eukprot:1336461-Lingulodinium_polyedra.AAC.1